MRCCCLAGVLGSTCDRQDCCMGLSVPVEWKLGRVSGYPCPTTGSSAGMLADEKISCWDHFLLREVVTR